MWDQIDLRHSTPSLALPDPPHQPVVAYSMNARREREGLGHYRNTFCSGLTGTRMGNNWLISSFEVGDAHVSVQNGSEESVVGVSQGYRHPDTESKARVNFFDISGRQ